MYIYQGHLGSLYATEYELDYDELYCEQCGDSDWLIGEADVAKQAWSLLKDETDIDGSGGWDYEYVQEFIKANFADDQPPQSEG